MLKFPARHSRKMPHPAVRSDTSHRFVDQRPGIRDELKPLLLRKTAVDLVHSGEVRPKKPSNTQARSHIGFFGQFDQGPGQAPSHF
ncbi:hypothetical protein J6590_040645 [Homalodisca vitripennis]|nr:hypothetical protein J6590_040645 [Homalodisca vitripennis]